MPLLLSSIIGLFNYLKAQLAKKSIFILLILLFFIRISQVKEGTLAFPDENLYLKAHRTISALYNWDYPTAVKSIFASWARPGYILYCLIPALIQYALFRTSGIRPDDQLSLFIPVVFNLVISVFNLYLFYVLSLRFLYRRSYALSATVIYALLANSNIFIRHLFPVDISLGLIFLSLFYITGVHKSHLLSGIFAGLAITLYPGYYIYPAGIIMYLLTNPGNGFIFSLNLARFTLGFLIPLLLLQALSLTAGVNYLYDLIFLSGTINQGDFGETFIFPVLYLWEVEKYIGISILAFYLVWIFKYILKRNKITITQNDRLLFFISWIMYLFYASLGYFFHFNVFYGRILHYFIPFIVIGALLSINSFANKVHKYILLGGIVVVSVFSYLDFTATISAYGYPRDLLYKHKISSSFAAKQVVVHDSPPWRGISSYISYPENRDVKSYRRTYSLLNFGYLYPIDDRYRKYSPPSGSRLVSSKYHFLTYPGYYFEAYNPLERKLLNRRKYKLEIFRLNPE